MGKTEKGTVFLSPELCTPYDFFQYWRNTPDSDVRTFLLTFTFLDMEKIDALTKDSGKALNKAKEILAFEVTCLIHGREAAEHARDAALSVFVQGTADGAPAQTLLPAEAREGVLVTELFVRSGLCSSASEARRLIQQGGARVNGEKCADINLLITSEGEPVLLSAGKKRHVRFLVCEKNA